ncbi:alpha/beta fold hydrolase [Nonomuraea sp. bgisy101]|uniref:alpha/beta fold hydrolase n=1 Tax=Nonomuraea sp. bgisy101 TaxID=3413784 RepID=UPI003D745551
MRAIIAVLLLLTATACSQAPAKQPTPRLGYQGIACPADVLAEIVGVEPSCGYLTVPESRATRDGATVRLFVIRFGPPGTASPDPMVVVGETLGQRKNYGELAPFAPRTHRSVIFLDQRGIGLSEPSLACPEVRAIAPELAGLRMAEAKGPLLEGVRACRTRLERRGIDLTAYSLRESAADVADLLEALGLEQVNLTSFGTASLLALEVMRRYPEHIRSVVLDSPALPNLRVDPDNRLREVLARAGQLCADAPGCRALTKDLPRSFDDALARLRDEPVTVTARSASGRDVKVVVDDVALTRLVTSALGYGGNLQTVAELVTGPPDWASAAAGLASDEGMCVGFMPECAGGLTHGLYYSLTCPHAAGPHAEACTVWPAGEAPSGEPVASDIPTLITIGGLNTFSGSAQDVAAAASSLTRARLLEIPFGNYGAYREDCPRPIRNAWIDDPAAPLRNTGCVKEVGPRVR